MSSITSLSTLSAAYNSAAANALNTTRPAPKKHAAGTDTAPADNPENAVEQAQAQSALQERQAAKIAEENAGAFKELADKGITVKMVSFAGVYKDKMISAVDTDGDKSISASELYQQVRAGGGSQAQAGALYKAMDMDKDGTVSAKEFKDSIPDPFSTPEFAKQVDALISAIHAGKADLAALMALYKPEADPGQTLGHLARDLPA